MDIDRKKTAKSKHCEFCGQFFTPDPRGCMMSLWTFLEFDTNLSMQNAFCEYEGFNDPNDSELASHFSKISTTEQIGLNAERTDLNSTTGDISATSFGAGGGDCAVAGGDAGGGDCGGGGCGS